jgi:hypothetical protein
VGVTVGQLLGGRFAHLEDLDLEVQRLPGQWMVGVDVDVELADLDHGRLAGAVVGLVGDHLARLRSLAAEQPLDWHALRRQVLVRAVALFRRHAELQPFAVLVAEQAGLEAGHQVAVAVQVGHRDLAAVAELVAFVVAQQVVERDHPVVVDLHRFSP